MNKLFGGRGTALVREKLADQDKMVRFLVRERADHDLKGDEYISPRILAEAKGNCGYL